MVIAPCNIVDHLCQPGKLRQALYCVREHLKGSSTFILDNSVPDIPFMVRANRVERVYEFEHPLIGTNITESYKARYDFANQPEYDEVELEECDDAGNLLRSAFSRDTLTYFPPGNRG